MVLSPSTVTLIGAVGKKTDRVILLRSMAVPKMWRIQEMRRGDERCMRRPSCMIFRGELKDQIGPHHVACRSRPTRRSARPRRKDLIRLAPSPTESYMYASSMMVPRVDAWIPDLCLSSFFFFLEN